MIDCSTVLAWAFDDDRTANLAKVYGLSIYDAAYLEVAERRALPLATLDQRLLRAAKRAGLEIVR